MPAERELNALLGRMGPVLGDDEFVFCWVPPGFPELPALEDAVCTFREAEGLTIVVRRADAERRGMSFACPSRMITLSVHSDLEAVGFLARITGTLADHGISVNVVSAYHHDHLFVPSADAERALILLQDLERFSR